MRRYSGLEVLEWIRNQSRLASVPIVIFTSSKNLDDIGRAYELGINAYLVKAIEYEELQDTIRTLGCYA